MKVVIVPKPVSLEMNSGNFTFSSATNIVADKSAMHEAEMLNIYLKKLYGIKLPVTNKITKNERGSFIIFKLLTNKERKDAYNLSVGSNEIIISSTGNEGLFYGMQTFLQLLPETKPEATSTSIFIPELWRKD